MAELAKRGLELSQKSDDAESIRRVCVIGGGALGSLISHLLGKHADVAMLSSFAEHVEAVNRQKGLLIGTELS
jgi:hypothetical protein